MQALLDANAQVTHSLATWNFLDHCLTIAKANLDNLPTGCADYSRLALAKAHAIAAVDIAHAKYDAAVERRAALNARLAGHEPRDDTQPPTAADNHSDLETP
jgi:hypothetical protein